MQQCNDDADRLMAQLQETANRMTQLTEELEDKTREYDTLLYEQQSMFHLGEVPSHSPLWCTAVPIFANAVDIWLMMLSLCQGCKVRWRSWKTLFKVAVLWNLCREHALACSEVQWVVFFSSQNSRRKWEWMRTKPKPVSGKTFSSDCRSFFSYVFLWKNLSCLKAFIILFKKKI